MKKLIFFMLILLSKISATNKLLDMEIYYNENMQVIAKKKYKYDSTNNIKFIFTYNKENRLESTLEYEYEDNLLNKAKEYYGDNFLVKIYIFQYQDRVLKEIDEFDINNNLLLKRLFIYYREDLIKIENRLPDNSYIGKKEFIYNQKQLIEENEFDEKDKLLITKKYKYKNSMISSIDFYIKSRRVRVIERFYLNIKDKNNSFGFKSNFYHIK